MEYTLSSLVVHGHQLGRRLGYPTANLGLDTLKGNVPPSGVYAARCVLPDGSCWLAMVNVGFRPTVDKLSHRLSIEAHLLDFDGDLYGQLLHLKLTRRIRDERRMESLDELRSQLAIDLEACRTNSYES